MTTIVGIAGGPEAGGRTSTAIRTAAVRAFPARPRTSARSPRRPNYSSCVEFTLT